VCVCVCVCVSSSSWFRIKNTHSLSLTGRPAACQPSLSRSWGPGPGLACLFVPSMHGWQDCSTLSRSPHIKKERKNTDNAREGWDGWEDGTPPPTLDFKERSAVLAVGHPWASTSSYLCSHIIHMCNFHFFFSFMDTRSTPSWISHAAHEARGCPRPPRGHIRLLARSRAAGACAALSGRLCCRPAFYVLWCQGCGTQGTPIALHKRVPPSLYPAPSLRIRRR